MTFGERLKALRESAGMTQEAVWKAAGLTRRSYLNYEQGQVSAVPFAAVEAIARVLKLDCTAFAGCSPADPPAPPRPPRKRKA